MDWNRHFGATESEATGPIGDHTTGNATGEYIRIERHVVAGVKFHGYPYMNLGFFLLCLQFLSIHTKRICTSLYLNDENKMMNE